MSMTLNFHDRTKTRFGFKTVVKVHLSHVVP